MEREIQPKLNEKKEKRIGKSGSMKRLIVALVIVVVVALGSWLWIGLPLFGAKLRVNLASSPPSEVSPGDTFEMVVEVINEGGGNLRDIVIHLEMPEGFTSNITGTNTRTVGPDSLSAYDGIGQGFVVTASKDVPLGSYTLGITVTADNVSPQILSPSVKVVKK